VEKASPHLWRVAATNAHGIGSRRAISTEWIELSSVMAPALHPVQPLRVGVDPLHAHLLPSRSRGQAVEPHLAFWSAATAVQQIRSGLLDALLLPLAGMVGPSEPPEPPSLTAAASLNPSLGHPEVVAIAVASVSLPFLVAGHHLVQHGAQATPSRTSPQVAVLLPPARHQPLLYSELLRQALLPLRCCSALNPAVWVERLQREPLLLAAPLSLLAASPWRRAGFAVVPPADPLWEVLWLVVREEELKREWVKGLVAGVRVGG
jgi:hypothetical protein